MWHRFNTQFCTVGFCFRGLAIALVLGLTSACTPAFEGEYGDPKEQEIVDDKWNETDARKTAESMIRGMLEKPWLKRYKRRASGKRPVVVVMDVENRTDEHLDVKALTEYIRDELINSGDVRFVNKAQRQKLLDEIKYQQSGHVSKKSAKRDGRQIGADFVLGGAVSSQVHTQGGYKKVTYQTNLTLTNVETFEMEWSNKYLITKKFRRSGASW